jgi:hypothetical protein
MKTEVNQSSAVWLWLKPIAIAVGIILSALQIWDWINKPTSYLVANIEFGNLKIPPGIYSAFKKINSLTELETIENSININEIERTYFKRLPQPTKKQLAEINETAHLNKDQTDFIVNLSVAIDQQYENTKAGIKTIIIAFYEFLHHNIPYDLPEPYNYLEGYWEGIISNNGDKTATGITLKLPNAKLISINKEDLAPQTLEINEIISFEKIKPQEQIKFYAWTTASPSQYLAKSIRLTHDSGLGEINISIPLGPFWQWLYKWRLIITVLLFIALVTVIQACSSLLNEEHSSTD